MKSCGAVRQSVGLVYPVFSSRMGGELPVADAGNLDFIYEMVVLQTFQL